MKKIFYLFLFFTLFFNIAFASNVRKDSSGRPMYAADRIKVKVSEFASERLNSVLSENGDFSDTGLDELDNLFNSIDVSKIKLAHRPVLDKVWEQETGFNRWYLLFIPVGTDIEGTITNISRNKYIEHAIPEYIFYWATTPNDPYFDECWGHDNTAQLPSYNSTSGNHTGPAVGTVGFDSHIEEAWDDTQGYGDSDIIIAILDSGVDYDHVDLDDNCVAGYDYGDGDNDPMDEYKHGTSCAGIAAAEVNNSIGVSGVAGNCKIMPLKISAGSGGPDFSAAANALTHCGDNDVDIASMSFTSDIDPGDDPTMTAAIEYAYDHGVTLLAATGNQNQSHIRNPANDSHVIAVGAASPCEERKDASSCDGEDWWGSNYGVNTQDAANAVDVVGPTILPSTDRTGAPGYSTGDYYMYFNGTSCATPYAAGVAALIKSKDPSLTPAEIKDVLTSTATDVMDEEPTPGWDRYTGYGMVNADAAVGAVGTNTWTGAYNNYWGNSPNWSFGHVPTSTEDVEIPNVNMPCIVDYSDKTCNNISIASGAELQVKDQTLSVNGDLTVSGQISMLQDDAVIDAIGNVVWESGSSLNVTASSSFINVYGNWNFNSGANVSPTLGFVDFEGASDSWIRTYDSSCNFYNLRIYKSGGARAKVSNLSTQDLLVENLTFINSGGILESWSDHDIIMKGSFNYYGTFDFTQNDNTGSVVFDGNSQNINNYSSGSGIFNNVVFSASSSANLLGTGITVAGDLTIEQGNFDPNDYTINVGGDWTNSGGTFNTGTSMVVFDSGGEHQDVIGTNTFYDIHQVNNSKYLRFNGATTILNDLDLDYFCWAYDDLQVDGTLNIDAAVSKFTANGSYANATIATLDQGGTIYCNGEATITINDLVESRIMGTYYAEDTGGTINLSNGGSAVDLQADLHIGGGTMNISGSISWWPYGGDASITMTDGILDLTDCGIYLSTSNTLTEDITGGTIRTAYGFAGARSDFNPTGGTIELYGSTDANVSMGSGSNFFNVEINKSASASDNSIVIKEPEYVIIPNRNGTETKYQRGNTITAQSELDINGDFTIDTGVFNPNDSTMYVAGDWTNNVGVAGFGEGAGRVVFDSDNHQYCYGETFNVLELNKPMMDFIVPTGTTTTCQLLDWTHYIGELEVDGGTFIAYDLEENGLYGKYYITDSGGLLELHQGTDQWIDLNGEIVIVNGTMEVYGGSATSYWSYGADASISMYGGVLDFKDRGIYIFDSGNVLTENISAGTIRTSSHFNGNRADFNPTGGTIELYGSTDATLSMGSGSNLFNVEINKSAPASKNKIVNKESEYVIIQNRDGTTTRNVRSNTVLLASDCVVDNKLTITEGALTVNGNELTVLHDFDVYGTLNMTNAVDVLNVGADSYDNLTFYSGSTGNISNGAIYLKSWIWPQAGCSFTASTSNTIHFIGSNTAGGLANDAPSTVYGNIDVNKSANYIYIDGSASEPIIVNGDFVIHAGNVLDMQHETLEVHGDFTDDPTSSVYLNYSKSRGIATPSNETNFKKDSITKGGSLEIDTDFTLNGLLDVGDGDVLAHGEFELASTGTLTIDGGSFINDVASSKDRGIVYLFGAMNMSDGLFEVTNDHISLGIAFDDSISGGRIKAGGTFGATASGTFEPSGGVIEFTSQVPGCYIQCINGNYFHDMEVNSTESIVIYDDLSVQNNLTITAGSLSANDKDLNVGGNWTNDVGDAGFGEGTGTVTFIGSNLANITTDETFYDLIVDKSVSGWDVIIEDSVSVNVLNNLNINAGTIEMDNSSNLDIDNDLNIASGAGLNAYLDQNLNIFVAGNWDNDNTEHDVYQGFHSGYSTVIFDGSVDQLVTSSCAADTFYNLIIDKADSLFRPTNDTEIFGDLDILNGTWDDNVGGLNHNLYGDVYVASTGDWFGSGCTVSFKGNADQTYEFLASTYLSDVIVDKSTAELKPKDYSEGEDWEPPEPREPKNQTVTLLSNMLNQAAASLTIEEGTLDLNGNRAGTYGGDIIINDGGKIEVDENAVLEVGDGEALHVNNGGVLEVMGSSGNEATVTKFSVYDNYGFYVNSGGTISAEHAVFEHMNVDGIYIKDGGIIDSLNSFNYCSFSNGEIDPGSCFLKINNDQELTINAANFPDNSTASYNIIKEEDQGLLTMLDASGDFAGEDYDFDPYNRIDWTDSYLPPVEDLTIQYNAGSNEIELTWTYSTSCDSFYIYRDTDPYFTPITKHAAVSGATTTWSEPAPGTKYFYIVTAHNDDPAAVMKK